ncbi:MAG: hypothetical protein JWR37_5894 [Mycobacterium sp.]|nr:hypothetical protein [Mycobacterium sp.]
MTVSVRMPKNRPRMPQPNGLRPFIAATSPHTMAATMLPIATTMPLIPLRMTGGLRIILCRQDQPVQHRRSPLLCDGDKAEYPANSRSNQSQDRPPSIRAFP